MDSLQNFETTIGPSVKVEGDLITAENIKIDGIVSGKVHTDANLSVGPASTIEASVEASSATVSGKIQGNVKAVEFLHLTESAKIYGDIEAKLIQIDKGAFFSGTCKMPEPEEGSVSAKSEMSEEPEA
jgi:cytoskeletal protein CcmA (bactofilin family)